MMELSQLIISKIILMFAIYTLLLVLIIIIVPRKIVQGFLIAMVIIFIIIFLILDTEILDRKDNQNFIVYIIKPLIDTFQRVFHNIL